MQNNVVVYTKDNCPYCVQAKNLLTNKNVSYAEMKIGVDLTREDFISIFPNVKSVPHIIINGEQIGGFDKLNEWLATDAGRSFVGQ